MWATSPGFTIKPEEMTVIVKSFKDPSSVFAEGFEISGHKYVTIRADESSLYGRKVRRRRHTYTPVVREEIRDADN